MPKWRMFTNHQETFVISGGCKVGEADTVAKVYPPYERRAKLLAAAPDLLEACRSTLRSLNDLSLDETLKGCAMVLEQAIAKAEGGSQ